MGELTSGTTHVVTVPGTAFKAYLSSAYLESFKGRPPKVEALLKSLAKTKVPGFPRPQKAAPVLQTIEEYQEAVRGA